MMTGQQVRYCGRCTTRLARDNPGVHCAACTQLARDVMLHPPAVPQEFWDQDQMRAALAAWHMGQVIRAYRNHPYHGRALSQELVANWFGLTQTQLSRIENGKPPEELSKLVRWATLLRIPAHLLWFKLPGSQAVQPTADSTAVTGEVSGRTSIIITGSEVVPYGQERWRRQLTAGSEAVDRREFMSAAMATAVTVPPTRLLASLGQAPVPDEVRESDIAQVESAARTFTSWDHTYGGGIVRDAVTAQLRWSARLLETDCPQRLRPYLFSAVGALGGVCGFMAFDAYAHEDARSMFAFGLSCAEAGGDWHLRAKLLSHIARQAIWTGRPDEGLTWAELALVRADRLTGTERAMLHSARARALAKLGCTQETLAAVAEADHAYALSVLGEDPPWMAYYDSAQHQGDTGHALFDLAVHGQSMAGAVGRLAHAVAGHTDAYARSRAISGTKLATLTMMTGDPREASAIGHRALDDAGQLRTRRAAVDMRELRGLAHTRSAIPEVAELQHRITMLVGPR